MTGIPYREAHRNLRRGWRDAIGAQRDPAEEIDPQVAWLAVVLSATLIPRRIAFTEPCEYFEQDGMQAFALALNDIIRQVREFEQEEAKRGAARTE